MHMTERHVQHHVVIGDGNRPAAAADVIVEMLGRYAPNVPGAVEARQILPPPDLEERFNLPRGHIFHGELLPDQIFE